MVAVTDATHTLEVFGPTLIHIPTGIVSDNEAWAIASALKSYGTNCSVGTTCGLPGQTLVEDNIAPRVHLNQTSANTFAGIATMSAGAATITFPAGFTYTSKPSCQASDETSVSAVKVTPSTGTLILHTSGATDVVDWICVGNPN
jgi:hypothetical protein